MKKTLFLIGLITFTTFSAASITVTELEVTPSNPEVGEETEILVEVEDTETSITDIDADYGEGWDSQTCNTLGICERTWTFTPTEAGTLDIRVEAENTNFEIAEDSQTITVEEEPDPEPTASFDFSPTNPEVGQEVDFDAGDSSNGEIVEYRWNFDDGTSFHYEDQSTISHTFNEPGEYDVELRVENEYGNTDSVTQTVEVAAVDETATLDVRVEDSETEETLDAYIEVRVAEDSESFYDQELVRSGHTGDDGEIIFELEPNEYEVQSAHPDYITKRGTLTLTPGDYRPILFSMNTAPDPQPPETARLIVDVTDEDSNPLEDVTVEARSEDEEDLDFGSRHITYRESTDRSGSAVFELEPGTYDVRASKDGYESDIEEGLELEAGEEVHGVFTLEEIEVGLNIDDLDAPDAVCLGDDFSVDVTVSNTLTTGESVELRGRGLGSITSTDSVSVSSGEIVTEELVFPNVRRETTGYEETFEITLENGDTDVVQGNVMAIDCPARGVPGPDATGLTLDVSPVKTQSGQPVTVSGFVDGADRGKEVTVYLNDRVAARTDTGPNGYYSATLHPHRVGSNTVTATVDNLEKSRTVNILATTAVGPVTAPDRAFQGETFQVCADVSSQAVPAVDLVKNGDRIDRQTGRGEVCFDVNEMELGTHDYTIESHVQGYSNHDSTEVEVLRLEEEVRNFPDQIASVKSGSGLVKVELYNTEQEVKTYDLRLEGLPEDWTDQTDKRVVLPTGERREVFFYFTPKERGDFQAELEIETRDEIIHQQTLDISSTQPAETDTSLLERLIRALGL